MWKSIWHECIIVTSVVRTLHWSLSSHKHTSESQWSQNRTKSGSLQIKVLLVYISQISSLFISFYGLRSSILAVQANYMTSRNEGWGVSSKEVPFCCESCEGFNWKLFLHRFREKRPKDRNIAGIVTRNQPRRERWLLVKSHACESEITGRTVLAFTMMVNEEQEKKVNLDSIRTLSFEGMSHPAHVGLFFPLDYHFLLFFPASTPLCCSLTIWRQLHINIIGFRRDAHFYSEIHYYNYTPYLMLFLSLFAFQWRARMFSIS